MVEKIQKLETLLLNVDTLLYAADQIGADTDDTERLEHFLNLFYMAKDKFAELKAEFYSTEDAE